MPFSLGSNSVVGKFLPVFAGRIVKPLKGMKKPLSAYVSRVLSGEAGI
jgi:hypothetical protein